MMAQMKQTATILAFAVFFSFVVLAVQFNSLKLPALILGCVPFVPLHGLHLVRHVSSLGSHGPHWAPGGYRRDG